MIYKYADELRRGDEFLNGEFITSHVTPDPFEDNVWVGHVKRENGVFGRMVRFYDSRRYAVTANVVVS